MRFVLVAGFVLLVHAAHAQTPSSRRPTTQPASARVQPQQDSSVNQQIVKVPEQRAWDKEPELFLGIRLGDRFTVTACPTKNFGSLVRMDTLDYDAMRRLESVCFDPLDPSVKAARTGGPSSYKLENLPSLGISYTASVRMKEGVVESVTIDLKPMHFDVLLEAFNQRYGPPTSIERGVVQNNAGADFSARDILWRGQKISIKMYERFRRVDESYVVVSDNALMEKEIEALRAKRAVEAQKF